MYTQLSSLYNKSFISTRLDLYLDISTLSRWVSASIVISIVFYPFLGKHRIVREAIKSRSELLYLASLIEIDSQV